MTSIYSMPFVTDISSTDFSGSESVSETESDLSGFNSYSTNQSGVGTGPEEQNTDGSLMRHIKSKAVKNVPKSTKKSSRDAFTKMLNYKNNENTDYIEENRSGSKRNGSKRKMSNLEIFELFKQNSLSEINDRIKIIPEVSGQLARGLFLDKIFALLLPVIFM